MYQTEQKVYKNKIYKIYIYIYIILLEEIIMLFIPLNNTIFR